MVDNVIPYIGGEEEKSEQEPLKLFGTLNREEGIILPAKMPSFTAQCLRVPASDGHMGAVFASFDRLPPLDEIIDIWTNYKGRAQELKLPSAPEHFLTYFTEDNRPQTKLDREIEHGMGISIGRRGKIHNMILNLYACLIIRSEELPAAAC